MSSHSSTVGKKTKAGKPSKPRSDFPLFAHATKRWAKKIRGKFHYFGPWDDPEAAEQKYLDEKEYLQAGRRPPENLDPEGLTILDLANKFLTAKKLRLDSGELSPRSFADYHSACKLLIGAFDGGRPVDDLRPKDFQQFRAELAKTRGVVTLRNDLTRLRVVLNYASVNRLIDRPAFYGEEFNKPTAMAVRKSRAQKTVQNGSRMFEADQLRAILDAAPPHIRTMVLLGLNCGFGQSDVANLPQSVIDFDNGWINFPRPKTGIERHCPLWAETIESLQLAIATRPKPKDPTDDDLVFLTHRGLRWVRSEVTYLEDGGIKQSLSDAIGREFGKLLTKLGIKRPGLNFYALRHNFETIGGESGDQVALDALMGHSKNDMASAYRERISDGRLKLVTDCIHAWLFPADDQQEGGGDDGR